MGSHNPFRHLKHKLWSKERSGVKLAIWLMTNKSWELTLFPRLQWRATYCRKALDKGYNFVSNLIPIISLQAKLCASKVTGDLAVGILGLSQPYYWKSGRITLTLLKWGLGSLLGLSKLQSSIARVKTHGIEVFFITLESYQSVDVEHGLAWAIWTSIPQVMAKRKVESQTTSLIPDH